MPPKKQPSGNRPRGNNFHRSVARVVRQKLHQARLTASPTWYKSPGQYKAPPEIPNSPPYFVKIRTITSNAGTDPNNITAYDIATQYTTLFTHLTVTRIDAWGPSSDATIRIEPTRQIGNTITADRGFYGTGVTGECRPYVSIMISPKDAITFSLSDNSTPITTFIAYDPKGATLETDFVIDFHCTFTNTSDQIAGLSTNFRRLTFDGPSSSPLRN